MQDDRINLPIRPDTIIAAEANYDTGRIRTKLTGERGQGDYWEDKGTFDTKMSIPEVHVYCDKALGFSNVPIEVIGTPPDEKTNQ